MLCLLGAGWSSSSAIWQLRRSVAGIGVPGQIAGIAARMMPQWATTRTRLPGGCSTMRRSAVAMRASSDGNSRRRGAAVVVGVPVGEDLTVTLSGALVPARGCIGEPSGPCMVLMLRLPDYVGEEPWWRVGLKELGVYLLGD
jgi:hypothetical protein